MVRKGSSVRVRWRALARCRKWSLGCAGESRRFRLAPQSGPAIGRPDSMGEVGPMTRRILSPLAAALLAAAVVVGGSAIAAGNCTRTQKLKGTAEAHAVGDGSRIVGATKDKYLGDGAVVFRDATVGPGKKIPFVLFAKNGSFKGVATADTALHPDGTLSITNCTLKYTGGGGAYKGATGKGTCDGSADAQANFTVHYDAKVKVPK